MVSEVANTSRKPFKQVTNSAFHYCLTTFDHIFAHRQKKIGHREFWSAPVKVDRGNKQKIHVDSQRPTGLVSGNLLLERQFLGGRVLGQVFFRNEYNVVRHRIINDVEFSWFFNRAQSTNEVHWSPGFGTDTPTVIIRAVAGLNPAKQLSSF